jgi:hypothetical protein
VVAFRSGGRSGERWPPGKVAWSEGFEWARDQVYTLEVVRKLLGQYRVGKRWKAFTRRLDAYQAVVLGAVILVCRCFQRLDNKQKCQAQDDPDRAQLSRPGIYLVD